MVTRRKFLGLCGAMAGASLCGEAESGTGETRARLNPWRLEPVDLRRFIRLGVKHIYTGCVNPKRGYLPLVGFKLTGPTPHCAHAYWGSPHMTGRFLDALAKSAEVVDVPHDDAAIAGLRKLIHGCLNNPYGLPFDTLVDPEGRKSGNMHHCREVLQALVGLATWRKCEESRDLARGLVRAMEKATRETSAYPAHILSEKGWDKPESGWINYTTGRSIGALVEYYRASKDDLAIDLAKRFADYNIKHTFTPAGELTKASGYHLHSCEGTMASLLALGVTAGEKRYLEFGRLLYDVGLKKWRTSWGWAKEDNKAPSGRGEANNTGDFIEAALTLAQNGHPEYFHDAERFVRNGLLSTQVVNTDWIAQSDTPDTKDHLYTNIRERARGAFAFTTPNGYHSYNADLVGGSLRALCASQHAAVTERDGACQVNMFFTVDIPALTMTSFLPREGRVEIRVKKPCSLSVRLPEGIERESFKSHVDGVPQPSATMSNVQKLGSFKPNTLVTLTFDQTRRSTREAPPSWPEYDVEWLGSTITSLSRQEGPIALY
jgi:beta-L-arabinofuranosidase (glycosyl hydrolase family 127)